jgi:hypothetical protein
MQGNRIVTCQKSPNFVKGVHVEHYITKRNAVVIVAHEVKCREGCGVDMEAWSITADYM